MRAPIYNTAAGRRRIRRKPRASSDACTGRLRPWRPMRSSSASRSSKPRAQARRAPSESAGQAQGRDHLARPGPHPAQSTVDRHRRQCAHRRDQDRRGRSAAAVAERPRAGDAQLARFAPRRHRRGAGGLAARRKADAAGAVGAARGCPAIAAHGDAARRRGAGIARPRREDRGRARRAAWPCARPSRPSATS